MGLGIGGHLYIGTSGDVDSVGFFAVSVFNPSSRRLVVDHHFLFSAANDPVDGAPKRNDSLSAFGQRGLASARGIPT